MRQPARRITRDTALVPSADSLTFNLTLALPGRASSTHTQRAYYRWIDQYLVDVAGLKPSAGAMRYQRMSALPLPLLHDSLSAPQLRAWLGRLAAAGHGRQGVNQARQLRRDERARERGARAFARVLGLSEPRD